MSKRDFVELELEILHVLQAGGRMTVKQVHQLIAEKNKYNTIMTVLVRLANIKKHNTILI